MAYPSVSAPMQGNALQRILAGLPGLGMKAAVQPAPGAQPAPRPMVVQANPADASLAKALLQGAYDNSPIETPIEGIGRLAQAWSGQKLERDYQEKENNKYTDLVKALSGAATPQDAARIMLESGDPKFIGTGLDLKFKPPAAGKAPDSRRGIDAQGREIVEDWDPKTNKWVQSGGAKAANADKVTYRPMTAEEKKAAGLPEADPYFQGSDGKPYKPGGNSTTVTVNNSPEGTNGPLDKKLSEEEGKDWAEIKKEAIKASGLSQDMNALDELLKVAPQGPITGRLAQMFPGFSSAGDAAMSIMMRVAPSLRTPGSGSTSDIEYEGFLRSIPRLQNNPQANQIISSVVKAKAALNMERGDVISRYQAREISIEEARRQLSEINKKKILTPEISSLIPVESKDAPKSAPVVIDGITIERMD